MGHTANTEAALAGAVAAVRAKTSLVPEIALILGSGLGDLAEAADEAVAISTADIPGYPRSTVQGHAGRLVFGKLEGRPVVFVQGRVHLYEGHTPRDVTFPVRLVHALGAKRLILTNAAGGIDPSFLPGTLMLITDHINFSGASPLSGPVFEGEPRFPDMSDPYDAEWTDQAERIALQLGVANRRGVYIWTAGPSYETPAEIKAFRRMGADAVGMSTVPECIQAGALGMRVLGISTITNLAAGLQGSPLNHEEVLEVGQRVRADLSKWLMRIAAEAE